MMFELCASAGCGISKEIASKDISLFKSFCSLSRKLKHHKESENVKFEGIHNVVYILNMIIFMVVKFLSEVSEFQ